MRSKTFINILLCTALLLVIPGCNQIENITNSSAAIIITEITGNDLTGSAGSTTIFSDVVDDDGSISNDNCTIKVQAYLINPEGTGNTYYQDVIIDQIDISFSRAEGLNVEGKDVPYRFSQKVTAQVSIGGSTEIGAVLIQHNAKLEPPLVDLTYNVQAHILKLEAHITVYGRDNAGNRVAPATGTVSVWCSNFGGSGSGGSGT